MHLDEQWWLGKKYTLTKYQIPVNDWMNLKFLNDRIWIEFFDTDFYFRSNGKKLTIPKYFFLLHPMETAYIELVAEKIELMSRPSKPCNSSVEYNFTKCVKVWYYGMF